MKDLTTFIQEGLKIGKDWKHTKAYKYFPENRKELEDIINKLIKERGSEADLNDIDTSKIDDMSGMFEGSDFNGNISRWNTSNVKNMTLMFIHSSFNGDISQWDVSNVINMYGMFQKSQFNQDISKWNVSSVENMDCMFQESQFNQDISKWNVSSVENMNGMFRFNKKFNQYLGDWNVSNVINMTGMFNGCYNFKGDGIKNWDVQKVKSMSYMFKNAKTFNEDISIWKLNKYVHLTNIFEHRNKQTKFAFNHDLTSWVSQIEYEEKQWIEDYIK